MMLAKTFVRFSLILFSCYVISAQAASTRVQSGLVALYEIEEGSGTAILDTSNNGAPLDLSINAGGSVSWIAGGLSVDAASVIRSAGAASKINSAVTASGEVTIEAWLRTTDLSQNGPARIVSLSQDPSNRNITLGQGVYNNGGDRVEVRTRTTATSNNGTPAIASDRGSLGTALTHVLYSMDATGFGRLWVDGVLVETGAIGGTLSNWNGAYPLVLANEVTGNRPWLGELHLVAFYDRALGDAEVTQNFASGASGMDGPGANNTPTALPISDLSSGAVTLTVVFDGTASNDTDGTIASWFWNFGDGSTDSSGPSVSHSYDTIGQYTAQLTVTDDMGATDTADLLITVTAGNVNAAAMATSTPGTLMVEFDATGSSVGVGAIASYLWSFGDGNTSTDAVVTHTYAAANTYTYSLTVTDDQTGTGEVTETINVSDATSTRVQAGLVALYELEEGSGALVADSSNNGTPLDLAIDDPGNVSWISGGLSVDTPTVIRSAGAASKITNAVTASGEVTVEAWLRTSDLSQNGPARIVSLSGDPSNRNITLGQGVYNRGGDRIEMRTRTTATSNNGTPAIASDRGSLSTVLQHVLFSMDTTGFGKLWIDGVMVESGSVGGALSNWNGAYPLALANEVSGNRSWLGELHLAAFYDRALSDAEVTQNFASGANGNGGPALNVSPTAVATSDVANGPVTLAVAFDGTASSDTDGTITSWFWDFGDGNTDGSGPSVSHAYDAIGEYTAQLTVTDNTGTTDTAELIITVTAGNVGAAAVATPTPGTLTVEFDATGSSVTTGSIVSYLWDYGDGNTSTDAVATHTYAAANSYTYTLTVTDDQSGTGEVTETINVSDATSTRVQVGLLALYEMEEGAGTVVMDTSNSGAPLNLSIQSGNTQWSNGALAAIGSSVVQSSGPATKIIDALKASNEMTIEAWVTSANLNQTGPARVVSISADPFSRNFTLGQGSGTQGDRIEARLRTSTTSANGQPSTITPAGTFGLNLTHLMVTRDTQGTVLVYVNGVVEGTLSGSGAFSSWSDQQPLTLFNEATGDRPWLGALHLVAIYDRVLTITDVSQNLASGPNGDGVGFNVPPTAAFDADPTSGDIDLLVSFDATASNDVDGNITSYSWDFGDGTTESGSNTTSHVYTAAGNYSAELTVVDDEGAESSKTVQIAVLDPNNPPELLVYDWNRPVTIANRGFPWNQPPLASANGDWTTPINYAQGTFYIRTIIRSQPVSQSMRLQFCIWQTNLTLETCTSTRSVQGNPGVVVTSSQTISSMWKKNGVPINWDSPRQRYGVAIKNTASNPVSNFSGWNWFGENPNEWYPLDMRYTVVVVPQGGTFSGWQNYPD